jgi:hypothetical protein
MALASKSVLGTIQSSRKRCFSSGFEPSIRAGGLGIGGWRDAKVFARVENCQKTKYVLKNLAIGKTELTQTVWRFAERGSC